MGNRPKPDVVVAIIGFVVVAIDRARVVVIIVPRTAAQRPASV